MIAREVLNIELQVAVNRYLHFATTDNKTETERQRNEIVKVTQKIIEADSKSLETHSWECINRIGERKIFTCTVCEAKATSLYTVQSDEFNPNKPYLLYRPYLSCEDMKMFKILQ